MRFNNLISRELPFGTLPSVVLIVLSLWAFKLPAQVSCAGETVETVCLNYPSQPYKCIDGNFDAPALYGTKLLPPAQAQTTAQFLIVKGKITFPEDYTFAAGSDVVFLDNNSGFRVAQTSSVVPKLTLNASYFHGCTKLWAGVEVMPSARITAEDCTFEDAKAAIILRNQSEVEATGNTFRKNICGILGLSANPGVNSSILLGSNKGISGNTFWGNDQLLESVAPASIDPGINSDATSSPTNYPYTGIWIERIHSLSIGFVSSQVGVPLNVFRDFGQHQEFGVKTHGIRSIESNVTVTNSTFHNFGLYDPLNTNNNIESDGIFARNDGVANKQTVVTGVNQTAPAPTLNTFSNCYRDIRTTGTSLTVTEVTSYKSGSAIRAVMANSLQNPIDCQIKNNKIDYFRAIGIEIGFFKPITIHIENNKLFDNDEEYDPAQRFGILIDNGTNAEIILMGSRIFNNEIRSRSMLMGGAFWGIAIEKGSYLTIEQNNIFDNLAQTNLGAFYGIRTRQSPCNGSRLFYNNVIGAKIDYSFAFGVFLSESLNCVLNCNSVDKMNAGMGFFGNCNNSDVRKNQFHYHGRGLSLGDPSINPLNTVHQIGLQSKKENRWYGANSPIEAFALNQASALASVFQINSSNLNSIFWPFPRKIGAVDDNFVWFVPATTGPEANDNVLACFITHPGPRYESELAGTDIDLLNGIYQPPFNHPAMTWEAKWEFADRLNRNPDLQNIDNDVAQYYQDTYNDTYSSLNRAYQGHLNRWKPDDPLTVLAENQTALLNAAITQRFALDAMLAENSGENVSLHAQMLEADLNIQNATTSLESTIENLNVLIKQRVNVLIAEVDNIVCTASYETDMKDVVKTMLLSHFTEGVLTSEQTARIAEIAEKCRYSGGYAVLLARGFLEPQDSHTQDADCEAEERSSPAGPIVTRDIQIFPNPANEIVTIQTAELFEHGSGLFSAQGQQMSLLILKGQSTQLPVNALANGLYILEVQLDGKPVVRKSFVVHR